MKPWKRVVRQVRSFKYEQMCPTTAPTSRTLQNNTWSSCRAVPCQNSVGVQRCSRAMRVHDTDLQADGNQGRVDEVIKLEPCLAPRALCDQVFSVEF